MIVQLQNVDGALHYIGCMYLSVCGIILIGTGYIGKMHEEAQAHSSTATTHRSVSDFNIHSSHLHSSLSRLISSPTKCHAHPVAATNTRVLLLQQQRNFVRARQRHFLLVSRFSLSLAPSLSFVSFL